jgi:excisionase family DNA binding protein
MEKIFYSIDEAAKILTISRSTINRLIAQGKIKSVNVTEKRVAIRAEELNRYIESIEG